VGLWPGPVDDHQHTLSLKSKGAPVRAFFSSLAFTQLSGARFISSAQLSDEEAKAEEGLGQPTRIDPIHRSDGGNRAKGENQIRPLDAYCYVSPVYDAVEGHALPELNHKGQGAVT
jgi:hypothetical protein